MIAEIKYKYLFGLQFRKIQDFVYRSDKLKKIVANSELLKHTSSEVFIKDVVDDISLKGEYLIVVHSIASIRMVFSEADDAEKFYAKFKIQLDQKIAYVRYVQAMVEIKDTIAKSLLHLSKVLQEKESFSMAHEMPYLSLSKISPKSRLPMVSQGKSNDTMQFLHREVPVYKDQNENVIYYATKLEDIAPPDQLSWYAIVSPDGNQLGYKMIDLYENVQSWADLNRYSNSLRSIFEDSFEAATQKCFGTGSKKYPIKLRPIILGGDDMCFIVEASKSIMFCREFVCQIETLAKIKFGSKTISDLTMGVGIALVKHKYPFHFGVAKAGVLLEQSKLMSERAYSSAVIKKVTKLLPQKESWNNEELCCISLTDESKTTIEKLQSITSVILGPDGCKQEIKEWLKVKTEPNKAERIEYQIKKKKKNHPFFKEPEAQKIYKTALEFEDIDIWKIT